MQSQKQKTIATHLSITSYFFCIFFADATFLMAGKGRSCSCNRGKRLNSQNLATFVNCSVARNSLLKTCRMLRVLNLKRDCIFCSRSQILDKSKKKKGSFVAAGIVQCILGCHSIIFAFIPTPTFSLFITLRGFILSGFCCLFLASQDALEVMGVTHSLTE